MCDLMKTKRLLWTNLEVEPHDGITYQQRKTGQNKFCVPSHFYFCKSGKTKQNQKNSNNELRISS